MKFLTWDAAILAAFVLLLAYSLLIRKHKSLATLISLYIAYVIASAWGERITQFLTGQRLLADQVWIHANVSTPLVQSALMLLVAFLISAFIKLGGRRAKYSAPEVVLYVFFTVALGSLFAVTFLSPDQRAAALATSRFLPYIYNWRELILVAPVFLMVFFGIYGNEET